MPRLSSIFFFLVIGSCFSASVPSGRSSVPAIDKFKKSSETPEEFTQSILKRYGSKGIERIVESHQRYEKMAERDLTELESLLFERLHSIGIYYKVVSAHRFRARTLWNVANNTAISGLIQIDEGSGQSFLDAYVWLNELAAVAAINPVISEISWPVVVFNSTFKAITFHNNENTLFSSCNSGTWRFRTGNCSDASDCDACGRIIDGVPEFHIRLLSNKEDMVELFLKSLISVFPVYIHTPFSTAESTLDATYPVYYACYSTLAIDVYSPSSTPFVLTDTTANLRAMCDNVNFKDEGFLYCYEGTPFSKQGGVDNSTFCSLTQNKCTNCINDGSCTGEDKCGYFYCEYSQDEAKFCDGVFCFSTFNNPQCCSLNMATKEFYFCPPLNKPSFTDCSGPTTCENPQTTEETNADSKTGGGCFIATAAFGSEMDPKVWTLRTFRDEYLLTNSVGKTFVEIYYQLSPPIANFIAQSEVLRTITRVFLAPFILVAQALI